MNYFEFYIGSILFNLVLLVLMYKNFRVSKEEIVDKFNLVIALILAFFPIVGTIIFIIGFISSLD